MKHDDPETSVIGLHWFRGHLNIDGEAVSFKSLLIEESLVALSSAFRCSVN